MTKLVLDQYKNYGADTNADITKQENLDIPYIAQYYI